MRITAVAALAAIAAAAASAQRTVTICRQGKTDFAMKPAQQMASEMFAAIGVTLNWHEGTAGCPSEAIRISLIVRTPSALRPGAFAYAEPYEDHICLFYDRVAEMKPVFLIPHWLAHVMVHEIGHVLQQSTRHSAGGVMKAYWTREDFDSMMWKPLPFTNEDINLIESGLAARSAVSSATPVERCPPP